MPYSCSLPYGNSGRQMVNIQSIVRDGRICTIGRWRCAAFASASTDGVYRSFDVSANTLAIPANEHSSISAARSTDSANSSIARRIRMISHPLPEETYKCFVSRASLRSSACEDLDVPWTRLSVGKRAGPAVWNNLQTHVHGHQRQSETLIVFKSRLKTHLSAVSYINWTFYRL